MINFKGSNNLGSRDMMTNRSLYDAYILTLLSDISEPTLETAQIKDFLKDEKMLYGRLDQNISHTVFPNSQYLKMIPSSRGGDGLQALNFVVDAFVAMKYKFDQDYRNGSLDPNSTALSNLSVKKAYTSPLFEYDKYVGVFVDGFVTYAKEYQILIQISDFDSFIPVFMDYIEIISKSIPVTRTMYFLSKYVSSRTTGLVLEVYEGDYSNDKLKADLFYSDRNFEYFKNLAYIFGFMVDKHIPWRLVADLNSPRMKKYITDAIGIPNLSAAVTIPIVYTETYPDDINMLATTAVSCYNELVRRYPMTSVVTAGASIGENSTRSVFGSSCKTRKTIYREVVGLEETINQYSLSYWFELYAKIRNLETGMDYDPHILDQIVNNAKDLSNSLDTSVGLGYISRKFDNVSHFEGSLFYDLTRATMSEDPNATEKSLAETVLRSVQASNFIVY